MGSGDEQIEEVVRPFQSPVEGDYTGYSLKTPEDVGESAYEDSSFDRISTGGQKLGSRGFKTSPEGPDDVESPDGSTEPEADPDMVKDSPGTDAVAGVGIFVFGIAFIVAAVFAFLGAGCRIGLCDAIDKSSLANASYAYRTYMFEAPLQYVLGALAASFFGMAVASFYALQVIKRDVGSPYMVEVATYIREGAHAFLLQEYAYILPVLLPVFGLVWLATNVRVALCYLAGAALSALTGWIGMSIATRGNVRTAAAAQESLGAGLNTAFRTGSVMGLTVTSLGLGGLCICYLILLDVRALMGFAAGASTIALFARVAGGIFTKAADVGADLVGKVESDIPEDDPRNPATIADNVGDNVGDVAGMGADLFESYVGSIIASAILGASLPYFADNQYAICVFNHLYLDSACVSYAAPTVKTSFAGQICRLGNKFLEYPELRPSESNSLFIALPFMLGLVGIISGVVCTAVVHIPSETNTESPEGRNGAIKKLLRSLRINVFLSSVLVLIGSAGLCWGMFGANSSFRKALDGPNGRGFERWTIQEEGTAGRCTPVEVRAEDSPVASVSVGLDSTRVPAGKFDNTDYMPVDSFGRATPIVSEIPRRLFSCILVGLVAGILIGSLTEYFTAASYMPTRGVAIAAQHGPAAVIVHGLGIGMLSTVAPLLIVVATVLIANSLFGAYGIGLTAVGMLSTLGVTMATDAYGPVADNAGGIAEMANMPSSVRDKTDALDAIGNTTAATGKGFSNGSAILTAYALVTALVHESSLAPSPRDLIAVQFQDEFPPRHISDADEIKIVDSKVIAGTFIGVLLPYVFGAFTMLAVSRAAQAMIVEVRRQFRDIPGLRNGDRSVRPDHKRCIQISTRSAILEMIIPGVIAIMAPLIVGFGLGQRALVGMLLGAIGSGYMLGIFMSNAGGAWDNAKKLVEAGEFGDDNSKGSNWHKAAVAGDTLGDPFKDTAGPAMNILIKMMASFALIAVPHMQRGTGRGWIGIILLVVTLLFVGIVMFLSSKRAAETRNSAAIPEKESPPQGAPLGADVVRRVRSPFYEAGPEIPVSRVGPNSRIGQELRYLERDAPEQDNVASRGAHALTTSSLKVD